MPVLQRSLIDFKCLHDCRKKHLKCNKEKAPTENVYLLHSSILIPKIEELYFLRGVRSFIFTVSIHGKAEADCRHSPEQNSTAQHSTDITQFMGEHKANPRNAAGGGHFDCGVESIILTCPRLCTRLRFIDKNIRGELILFTSILS